MERFRIFTTNSFEKRYQKLPTREQAWIQKVKENLEEFPTGKILRFYWLREKKFENKRVYYLLDEEKKIILLVAYGSKKEQQEIIDQIIEKKKEWLDYLRTLG